jgi:hypothetical protein
MLNIWKWFNKPRKNSIQFYIEDNTVKIISNCGDTAQDIQDFAEMLYGINSGNLYHDMLSHLSKEMSMDKITTISKHIEEMLTDAEFDEDYEDDDEEISISPLDIFGGTANEPE